MGTIRHETYYAGDYIINQLERSGALGKMLHDGADIILFRLRSGEQVSLHLIESGIPVYEIRNILKANAEKDIYTMFLLWCAMMVPEDGREYVMDDWMQAFLALNGDYLYAYDILESDVYLFPVYFRGEGLRRRVEYGTTLRAGQIRVSEVDSRLPDFAGTWKVAHFGVGPATKRRAQVSLDGVKDAYVLLGVSASDDLETIKKAYRLLARRYHPDTNQDDDDTTRSMQQINVAYEMILNSRET